MSVLVVIYWVILLLCLGSYWLPEPYAAHGRFIPIVLFVIIGLKLFGMPN